MTENSIYVLVKPKSHEITRNGALRLELDYTELLNLSLQIENTLYFVKEKLHANRCDRETDDPIER